MPKNLRFYNPRLIADKVVGILFLSSDLNMLFGGDN